MKTTGIIFIIFGSLALIGTIISQSSAFGPLFWILLGIFLIIRANQKKKFYEEQQKKENEQWNNLEKKDNDNL